MRFLIILYFIIITSCNTESGWQILQYDESLSNNILETQCKTNHQGEHELNKCNVYQDGDTLMIHFLAELPAYWGSLKVKIVDGKYNAQFEGIPFMSIDLKHETVKQKLTLNQVNTRSTTPFADIVISLSKKYRQQLAKPLHSTSKEQYGK